MTDLWSEASYEKEAEDRAFRLEMAASRAEGTWAFLALAQDRQEFSDRYALAAQSMARIAKDTGVSAGDVGQLMIDRFALLMEAKGNPFDKDDDGDVDADDSGASDHDDDSHGDHDSDQDDSDDDEDKEDSDKDDSHVDDAGTDDSDDNGADGDDDHEQDDDGDDNADDDESGHAKDDDQDDDMDGRESAPFGGIYSHLLAKINAGEDPLAWGRRPFVRSLVAAFGDDGAAPVSDENVPTPEAPSAMGGTGFGANTPLTTKPRQMPGGSQQLSEPPGGSAFDPALNGGDIDAGEDSEVTASLHAKRAFIADEVQLHNPGLSVQACLAVADQVLDRYFKTAEDLSPLLYGDRGDVADGPLTNKVKNWSPPNLPGKSNPSSDGGGDDGGGGGDDGGDPQPETSDGGPPELSPGTGAEAVEGGGEGAAAIGGAGEAAGAGASVADLLPLLAL